MAGRSVRFIGLPIIRKAPGSTIEIGSASRLVSVGRYTALGVVNPVILDVMRPGAFIKIGSKVGMSGTVVCACSSVTIGDRVQIGSRVIIADTDFHSLDPLIRGSVEDLEKACTKPVKIGDDVFLGVGAMILKGSNIGKGAVIGAGAVVAGDIPERAVVVGNPAKVLRLLKESGN